MNDRNPISYILTVIATIFVSVARSGITATCTLPSPRTPWS